MPVGGDVCKADFLSEGIQISHEVLLFYSWATLISMHYGPPNEQNWESESGAQQWLYSAESS